MVCSTPCIITAVFKGANYIQSLLMSNVYLSVKYINSKKSLFVHSKYEQVKVNNGNNLVTNYRKQSYKNTKIGCHEFIFIINNNVINSKDSAEQICNAFKNINVKLQEHN